MNLLADLAVAYDEPATLPLILVTLFFMFLGGSIGSFLNVVIYRVPAGLSIVRPASRCPRCLTPILTRDNLPVVGWLLLRGRCRACRAPIAARYPLVEFVAGAIFTALAFGELVLNGATLPLDPAEADLYPLFGMTIYHFALLCSLGAAAMIVYDGAIVPKAYWRIVSVIGFVPPLIWPLLRPISIFAGPIHYDPLNETVDLDLPVRLLSGGLTGIVGLLFGALIGGASWPAASHLARARNGHFDAVAMLGAVGLFLGWQAAAGIGVVAAAAWALRQIVYCLGFKPRVPWQAYPAIAALLWILAWRWIVDASTIRSDRLGHRQLFGGDAPLWLAAAALAITFLISLAARRFAETAGRQSHASQGPLA